MTEKKLIPFLSLIFFLFFASYSFAAEVHFQWGASSGVVEGYRIYYGSSHEGPYPNLLVQVGGTTTEYLATLNEGQEYYLVVRAFNDYGESGNSNEVIVEGGSQPNAVIHTDVTSGYVPLTVQFDASGSSDPDGVIVSYQWNFGDGESDIGEVVEHTFQTAGEYTVTLTVEDNEGATAQAQITITAEEESVEVTVIPYIEMTLIYVDSEETYRGDGRGINAIDGNPSTMWHTEWSANDPIHPHGIVIDLGYERQVCGFNYLPRQYGSYNGGIAEYEFYVSVDCKNWGRVASGIFPRTKTKQEVVFYPKCARYVVLVALSEVNGHPWTSAAEIEVMER